MIASLIVSTLLSAQLAHAQNQTPPAGGPPPVVTPPPETAGKAPTMLPPQPMPSDTKIKGDECNAEAKAAGCKEATINQALLQCMMGYKKAHHEYSVGPACRVAIQKWHMAGGKFGK